MNRNSASRPETERRPKPTPMDLSILEMLKAGPMTTSEIGRALGTNNPHRNLRRLMSLRMVHRAGRKPERACGRGNHAWLWALGPQPARTAGLALADVQDVVDWMRDAVIRGDVCGAYEYSVDLGISREEANARVRAAQLRGWLCCDCMPTNAGLDMLREAA